MDKLWTQCSGRVKVNKYCNAQTGMFSIPDLNVCTLEFRMSEKTEGTDEWGKKEKEGRMIMVMLCMMMNNDACNF